jgi:hypothetical protein
MTRLRIHILAPTQNGGFRAASPGAAGRPLTDFEQVLLGVIASKHGIGILDALTQGATGTA